MSKEATQEPKKEKQWEHCGPGEVPEKGEAVKCPDGEGAVEDTHGHTVQVKLKNGFYWRGGIEQLKVLR